MGGYSESPIGWMDFTEHGPRHLLGGSQATAALWRQGCFGMSPFALP
jgi:hypothetical protein